MESDTASFSGRGGAEVSSSGDAYKGDKGLSCSGRTAEWNGIQITLDSTFNAGEEYSISAAFKGKEDAEFKITLQYGSGNDASYDKVATASTAGGSWVMLSNSNYMIPAGASDLTLVFETTDSTCDFSLDEVILAKAGTKVDGPKGMKTVGNSKVKGELEPLIVVCPTFNKCTAQTFYKEWMQSLIPFIEGKCSTYAESTSEADIKASRFHRAYGGFSMGSCSTWAGMVHGGLDICAYWLPLSGDNWEADGGYGKAKSVADAIDKSGLKKNEYFIMCATGSEDIAYPNMNPQIDEMKKMSQFVYTSDFSQGNFYYLVAPGKTHWWGYVRHYVYDVLPSFFHEGQ